MSSSIDLQPAYVLHTRPFRDTSLLVDFLCLDHGRVRAVARGARRPASRLRGILQPFQPLLVSLVGRGELMTLRGVESSTTALTLGGTRLFSGLYLNELLTRLLGFREPHPALFRLYQQALLQLHEGRPVEAALRRFELELLGELGYGIDLCHEANGGRPLEATGWYMFDPAEGFEAVPGPDDAAARVFRGRDLLGLHRGELDDEAVRRAAKRLLRQALDVHLGDRPLSSRSLFPVRALSAPEKNR